MKLIKKLVLESLLKSVIFRNNTDAKTLINVKLLNVIAYNIFEYNIIIYFNKIKYKDETKLKNWNQKIQSYIADSRNIIGYCI